MTHDQNYEKYDDLHSFIVSDKRNIQRLSIIDESFNDASQPSPLKLSFFDELAKHEETKSAPPFSQCLNESNSEALKSCFPPESLLGNFVRSIK